MSAQADKRAALLAALQELAGRRGDPEAAHIDADRALLDYINDPEVTTAYDAIAKWYA